MPCKPLPGELARSHARRLQLLNGRSDQLALLRLLRRNQSGPFSPVEEIARAAGEDLADYAFNHTFLPYWIFRPAITRDGQGGTLKGLAGYGLSTPQPTLKFCRLCRAKDVGEFGFSYWRRDHQIAGASLCLAHGASLSWHKPGQAPEFLPHESSRRVHSLDKCHEQGSIDAISRYHQLATHLMNRSSPVFPASELGSLRSSVTAQVGPGTPWAQAKALLELAHEMFGERWITGIWLDPNDARCKALRHRTVAALGMVLKKDCRPVTEAVLLIAAMLSRNVEEGWRYLSLHPVEVSPKTHATK